MRRDNSLQPKKRWRVELQQAKLAREDIGKYPERDTAQNGGKIKRPSDKTTHNVFDMALRTTNLLFFPRVERQNRLDILVDRRNPRFG
jgi:hypothetical protein